MSVLSARRPPIPICGMAMTGCWPSFFFLPSEPFPSQGRIGRKRLGGWANLGLCYIPSRRRPRFFFPSSFPTATWTWRLGGGWAILGLVFFFFLSKVAVAQDTDPSDSGTLRRLTEHRAPTCALKKPSPPDNPIHYNLEF